MRFLKLIIFFLVFLLLSSGAAFAQEVFDQGNGLWSTRELSARTAAGPEKKLLIRSVTHLSGDIRVQTAPVGEVTVKFVKRARTDSRSNAIDYIDLISVSLERLPGMVRLDFRAPNPAPWDQRTESGELEAVVTVPLKAEVEIDAMYFDVNVVGPLKSLRAPSSLGRFDVKDVNGTLEIATANQKVNVEDISGDISISTTNSPIMAKRLRTSEGTTATIRNEGGTIDIEDFAGSINLKGEFGRITLTDFRPSGESNFIRSSSGPVIIGIAEMTQGQLVINNRNEDIEITIPDTLSAFLSMAVSDGGSIEATGFLFKTDLVKPNRLNLITGSGAVEISGSVRGEGNIYVRGVAGE